MEPRLSALYTGSDRPRMERVYTGTTIAKRNDPPGQSKIPIRSVLGNRRFQHADVQMELGR